MSIKLYNNPNREKLHVVFTNLYNEIVEGKATYKGVLPNLVSNECTRVQGFAFRNKMFRITFDDGELVQGLGLNCFVARFVNKVQAGGRLSEGCIRNCFPWMHAYELRKIVFEVEVEEIKEKAEPKPKTARTKKPKVE